MDKIHNDKKMIISGCMYGNNYLQIQTYLKQFKDHDDFQDMLHYALQEALSEQTRVDPRRVFNILNDLGLDMKEHAYAGRSLCQIVQRKEPSFLNRVLSTGANPNMLDEKGKSPLYYAAIKLKNAQMVKSLLNAGADPELSVKHDVCNTVTQMVKLYMMQDHQVKTPETSQIITHFKQAARHQQNAAQTLRTQAQNKATLQKVLANKPIRIKRRQK